MTMRVLDRPTDCVVVVVDDDFDDYDIQISIFR